MKNTLDRVVALTLLNWVTGCYTSSCCYITLQYISSTATGKHHQLGELLLYNVNHYVRLHSGANRRHRCVDLKESVGISQRSEKEAGVRVQI